MKVEFQNWGKLGHLLCSIVETDPPTIEKALFLDSKRLKVLFRHFITLLHYYTGKLSQSAKKALHGTIFYMYRVF